MPQPAHNDGKLHFSFPAFYLRKERKGASCPKPDRPPPLTPARRLSAPWRRASGPELCSQFLRSHRRLWGWVHHQLPGPARARRTPGEPPPWRFKEDESTRISTAAVTAGLSALGMQRTCQQCPGSGSLAHGRGRGITRPHHFLGSPTDLPQCRGLNSICPPSNLCSSGTSNSDVTWK